MKPLGIILYKGPSLLDGKNIVVIATGLDGKGTKNEKLGDMIPISIIRRDVPPCLAAKIGDDSSVCGDCKHRDFHSCYVTLHHSPQNIYDAFHRDRYVNLEPDLYKLFHGRYVRIGAYGDPAAVPIDVWQNLCLHVAGYTGYTHQWKTCNQQLKHYCMASVDSTTNYYEEYHKAREMGWRTFRVRVPEDSLIFENEFVCPASKEAGKKATCDKCGACRGIAARDMKSVVIIAHGGGAKGWRGRNYAKGMKRLKNKKKYRVDFPQRLKNLCLSG
jgi:hypothetical protein